MSFLINAHGAGIAATKSVSSVTATGTGNTFTASAVSLGTPSATRAIVVVATYMRSNNRSLVSATINGVTATLNRQGDVWQYLSSYYNAVIFSAFVPSGTTGDIVMNMSGSMNAFATLRVYEVHNLQSLVNRTLFQRKDNALSSTYNIDLDTQAGGLLFFGCVSYTNAWDFPPTGGGTWASDFASTDPVKQTIFSCLVDETNPATIVTLHKSGLGGGTFGMISLR